jgi:hypothetical protein
VFYFQSVERFRQLWHSASMNWDHLKRIFHVFQSARLLRGIFEIGRMRSSFSRIFSCFFEWPDYCEATVCCCHVYISSGVVPLLLLCSACSLPRETHVAFIPERITRREEHVRIAAGRVVSSRCCLETVHWTSSYDTGLCAFLDIVYITIWYNMYFVMYDRLQWRCSKTIFLDLRFCDLPSTFYAYTSCGRNDVVEICSYKL